MKKIILLFALLITVGTISAKKDRLYAAFNSVSGATYTDNTFSWSDGTTGKLMKMFTDFDAGTLNNYSTLYIKVTDMTTTSDFRIQFHDSSNDDTRTVSSTDLSAEGIYSIDLSTVTNRSTATTVRLLCSSSSGSGSFTIKPTDVYLEKATDEERMDITSTVDKNSSTTTPFAWDVRTSLDKNFESSISEGTILWGYQSGFDNSSNGCFYVTGYDKAMCHITAGTGGIRFYASSTQERTATLMAPTISVSDFSNINTLKTKDGALTVESIDFIKEFKASSTIAFSIVASKSSTVEYDRYFYKDRVSTVCLPFDLSSSEISSLGDFYYLNNVTGSGQLQFKKASSPSAYTPYLFVPKSDGKLFASLANKDIKASTDFTSKGTVTKGDWKFQGTLAHVDDVTTGDNSSYSVFGWDSSDGSFKKAVANSGVSIDAFRAYILGPSNAGARLNVIFDDEATGIETMNREPLTVNQTYNLSGQRVSQPTKGLYIVNGKKVVVK